MPRLRGAAWISTTDDLAELALVVGVTLLADIQDDDHQQGDDTQDEQQHRHGFLSLSPQA